MSTRPMPWTFAHPAAILPLRRWCPNRLNLAALVIGAVTPDFGYYIDAKDFATLAHTPVGSFLACLPTGVGLLALFYLLRGPFWYVLPQPHRRYLAPASLSALPRRPTQLLAAAASLLIGAWTHILWDWCTHISGWVVTHVSALRATALTFDGHVVPVYKLLQHASTLVGSLFLIAAYRTWLQRAEVTSMFAFEPADRWRYRLLLVSMLVAVLGGTLLAYRMTATPEAFVFHAAIQIVVIFVALLGSAAVLCYLGRAASPSADDIED